MNNTAPSLNINPERWLQVLRDITRSTDERTLLTTNIPLAGMGHSVPVMDHAQSRTIASALVLANMNSLPLDWATRLFVGGTHLSFYIVKQLPVLSPEIYLEQPPRGGTWAQYIIPRVLELTYTARNMASFARDLGYVNEAGEVYPPFPWDSARRHHLQSELDAIYAHMYGLQRANLEWVLNASEPSTSFLGLKHKEVSHLGEYRTQRYVLQAYDQIARGELPNLEIS